MFARIVEMTSDPNQWDKTNEIFRNSIPPAIKQQKGFEGAIQCMNQQGEGVAVSLWESQEEEALGAGEQIYLEQISKFREVFTKPQVRHTGEVRAHDTRAGIAPRAARLTVLPTRPGSYQEQMAKFKPHLTGEPSRKIFDVAVHEVLARAPTASERFHLERIPKPATLEAK